MKIRLPWLCVLVAGASVMAATDDPAGIALFESQIRPVLVKHCYECHAAGKEEGGFNLGIRQRAFEGGVHGPMLIRGDSANSRLIHLVASPAQYDVRPPTATRLHHEQTGLCPDWTGHGATSPRGAPAPAPTR